MTIDAKTDPNIFEFSVTKRPGLRTLFGTMDPRSDIFCADSIWLSRRARISLPLAILSVVACLLQAQSRDAAAQIYHDASPSVFVVSVRNEAGAAIFFGSWFLVGKNTLVTNLHVVEGGAVFLEAGDVCIPVSVEKRDTINDLAVVRISADISASPLVLSEKKVTPGENVFAIGNPEGLEKSISTGVVSAVRDFDGRKLIQMSAPISHGSSGGPVLNSKGEVIGVTVAMLKDGQNLNFAVPAEKVRELIVGGKSTAADLSSLLRRIEELEAQLKQQEYSNDSDSLWQKTFQHIHLQFTSAIDAAGSNPDLLTKVAQEAAGKDLGAQLVAAERSTNIKPSGPASYILGEGLRVKASFADEPEKSATLKEAEQAFRTAIRLTKTPNAEMYYGLADVLEERGSIQESQSNFYRAFQASNEVTANSETRLKPEKTMFGDDEILPPETRLNSIRGMARTTFALKRPAESQLWFEQLVELGGANDFDWRVEARRLSASGDSKSAGESFEKAASLGTDWTDWCLAANFLQAVAQDSALSDARKCIEQGTGKKNSEKMIAIAHQAIASILDKRGVYSEGLSHAREATDLDPTRSWAFQELANALFGLRRFQEAVNASNQAIRLSDGKFGEMHFRLGTAYFELENWEFARQSFEKAAQMSPTDTAAPYNVALCLIRLGFRDDAAKWYEEVLQRDPQYKEKDEIRRKIYLLRSASR